MKQQNEQTRDKKTSHFDCNHNKQQSDSKTIPCYEKLLLNIPHSSSSFPSSTGYTFVDLDEEEKLLIDYFTDELFAHEGEERQISCAVFPYCRLYCDVERLVNDPLEQKGLGISYKRILDSNQSPSEQRTFGNLNEAFNYYADFHVYVSKKIVDMTFINQKLLLLDCHSFSSQPNLLNTNPPDIDICIGFNEDETKPCNDVLLAIETHFKECGYKVGINNPFSNSKTFLVPVRYHSVMIEVNKRLYMNEQTLEKTDQFEKLRASILALYTLILSQGL